MSGLDKPREEWITTVESENLKNIGIDCNPAESIGNGRQQSGCLVLGSSGDSVEIVLLLICNALY